MRVNSKVKPLILRDEDAEMSMGYSNRGEPYREGVEFSFRDETAWVSVLVDAHDAVRIRDKLNEFLSLAPT